MLPSSANAEPIRIRSRCPQGLLSNPLAKAAITSGGFSLTGDLIAQIYGNKSRHVVSVYHDDHKLSITNIVHHCLDRTKTVAAGCLQDLLESIDLKRAACMGSFGLLFYGPYQHWWYGLLGSRWPSKSTSDFLIKVLCSLLRHIEASTASRSLIVCSKSPRVPRQGNVVSGRTVCRYL